MSEGAPDRARVASFVPDAAWASGRIEAKSGHLELGGRLSLGPIEPTRAQLWVAEVGRFDVTPDALDPGGLLHVRAVVPIGLLEIDAELIFDFAAGPTQRLALPRATVAHVELRRGAKLELPGGVLIASLDLPEAAAHARAGEQLPVTGWAYACGGSPVRDVWVASAEGTTPLVYGAARPDVREALPEEPGADRSGFCGAVVAPRVGAHLDLELWVELEDGTRRRFMSRRVHVDAGAPEAVSPKPSADEGGGWLRRVGRRARELIGGASEPSSSTAAPPSVTGREAPAQTVPADLAELARERAYARFREANRITPALRARLRRSAAALEEGGPELTLLLPVHAASVRQVRACLASVGRQLYGRWQLHVLDLGTSGPYLGRALREVAADEPRVHLHAAAMPRGEAPRWLSERAAGDFVALIEPDVALAEDALLHVAERLAAAPRCDVLYTDEDTVDAGGRHVRPRFKLPWNPALSWVTDHLGELVFFAREPARDAGGFDPSRGLAQVHDLVLRVTERAEPPAVVEHVPVVACHVRRDEEAAVLAAATAAIAGPVGADTPTIDPSLARPDSRERARDLSRVLAAALERRGLAAEAIPAGEGSRMHALRWSPRLLREHPITLLVPTRDRTDLLRRCVASLRRTVAAESLRVVIIDDHSVEPETHTFFAELARDPCFTVVKQERPRERFNFARLINFGMGFVDTPLALILNSDTEARHEGWLEDLVGWASLSDVGVVGARLLYDDGTVQHAGVIIGLHGGLADHLFHHRPADSDGYLGLARLARDASAVTGACLLTPTALYRDLGGLDEEHFSVDYNDIDYCLRVRAHGLRVVYTPGAELVHMGSASRGRHYESTEHENFARRYAGYRDPMTSAGFHRESPRLEIDPRRSLFAGAAPELLDVLVVAAEGATDASSEVSDYLDGLLRVRPRWRLRLLPTRPAPLGDDRTRWRASIAAIAAELSGAPPDVVLAHGAGAHWAVELARQLERPSVWYIGALYNPEEVAYRLGSAPSLLGTFRRALERATRVAFASEHVMPAYAPYAARDHHRALPIGASLRRLDSYRRAHSRAALRARYGLSEDEPVVLFGGDAGGGDPAGGAGAGIGAPSAVLDPRFGAKSFLIRDHLGRPLDGRGSAIPRLDLIGLGDVMVVRSLGQEVFPRLLAEAMAFECMIVGPHGPGFGEVIGDTDQGLLYHPPFDAAAYRAGVGRALSEPEWRREMALRARTHARLLMDCARLVPRHARLIEEAVVAYEA